MSKKRNQKKAQHWVRKSAGMMNSNTSQNAMISSHTMLPWSGAPRSRPVLAQAATPMTKPTTTTMIQFCGVNIAGQARGEDVAAQLVL